MATGKKAASDAARILRNPKSTKKQKEVAGSDLAQRRRSTKRKSRRGIARDPSLKRHRGARASPAKIL